MREHAFPSYDCKRGECGVCLTRVLAGEPVHRDVYQADEEKATNEFMTVCVSRAKNTVAGAGRVSAERALKYFRGERRLRSQFFDEPLSVGNARFSPGPGFFLSQFFND